MRCKINSFKKGLGICKGKFLFKGVDLGDVVEFSKEAVEKRKKFYYVKKYNFIEKSPNHIQPFCEYFSKCGGCSFQHLKREYELKLKEDYIKKLVAKYDFKGEIKPIIYAQRFNYRNRIDFLYNYALGFHEFMRFNSFVKIDECKIAHEKINEIKRKIENTTIKIMPYDLIKHEGVLRYIVIRTNGKSVQINVVVNETNTDVKNFIKEIEKILQTKDSLWLSLNTSLSDSSQGKLVENYLEKYIFMNYEDLRWPITPNAFFQTNHYMFPKMFNIVERIIKQIKPKKVIDLFSGIGVFASISNKYASHVIAVDNNSENIKLGNIANELNKTSIKFLEIDAKEFSKDFNEEIDLLIIDPPREGLHRKTIEMINRIKPKNILYVSCNPETQFRDIFLIKNNSDYKINMIQPLDMFPNTPHSENIVWLKLY